MPDAVAPGYYGAPDDAEADLPSSSPVEPQGMHPSTVESEAEAAGGDAVAVESDSRAAGGDAVTGPSKTTACDLTGRWLATDREVATALGSQEAAHTWLYLEISQTGSQATVTKGLECGEDVRSISAVGGNVDYPKAWPAILTHDPQTGRKATSTATSSGCSVSFEKRYTVVGATVPFYDDPSQALPTSSQQGSSNSPGWEDWDQDGNPGITMNVTGLAVGQLYMVTRKWNAWSGTVAAGANRFQLADSWNNEQSLLGYSGPSLLTSATSGTRDNNASLHFIEFARLDDSQAGDDATTCAAVRMLAPTLTPNASN